MTGIEIPAVANYVQAMAKHMTDAQEGSEAISACPRSSVPSRDDGTEDIRTGVPVLVR